MTHEDQLIAQLLLQPGYPVLCDRLEEEYERRAKVLTSFILHDENPVDQRMVDFERGFIAGGAWFLREIAKKDRQLVLENEEVEEHV